MTRFTSWTPQSWTPVCPGPGFQPRHQWCSSIHGLQCTGIYPCKPSDCFPSPGAPARASTVITKSSGSSATAASPTWSTGPDPDVGSGHPEPQPPEPCYSPSGSDTLTDAPHRDTCHAISAGTTGPHPHRQGSRCVPPNHPAPFPASNSSPVWASGRISPGRASLWCGCIGTLLFHPGGGWADNKCRWCPQFHGVTCHISEYRSQTSAKPVRWTSNHNSHSQPAASTTVTECSNSQS